MLQSPIRLAALTAVLLVSAEAGRAAEGAVMLQPHRAVYDLRLVSSEGQRGLAGARGRIVVSFTGDDCEGYSLTFRQAVDLQSAEGGPMAIDSTTASFESGDGLSYRFRNELRRGSGPAQITQGQATKTPDGAGEVVIERPRKTTLPLPPAAIFPNAHTKAVVAKARSNERILSVPLYDGGDDGQVVYDSLTIIGKPIAPDAAASLEAPARDAALAGMTRWPVKVSYFKDGSGERTPAYTISYELYENGVSRALVIDYGDFVLAGDLSSFEALPLSDCAKKGR